MRKVLCRHQIVLLPMMPLLCSGAGLDPARSGVTLASILASLTAPIRAEAPKILSHLQLIEMI